MLAWEVNYGHFHLHTDFTVYDLLWKNAVVDRCKARKMVSPTKGNTVCTFIYCLFLFIYLFIWWDVSYYFLEAIDLKTLLDYLLCIEYEYLHFSDSCFTNF